MLYIKKSKLNKIVKGEKYAHLHPRPCHLTALNGAEYPFRNIIIIYKLVSILFTHTRVLLTCFSAACFFYIICFQYF